MAFKKTRSLFENIMVSFNKKTLLQIGNILTPIICFTILGILSIGQGDFTNIFESESESLIDPIDFTFAIWGPIFLFLIIFLVYQARGIFKPIEEKPELEFVDQVSIYFMLSTVLTSLWYIFWIYRIIWLSTLSMIFYLISLIIGYLRLNLNLRERSNMEKVAIYIPWSMYTAWITAATIVSITTFFESIGFNDPAFLFSDEYWGVIILVVTLIIYTAVLLTRNDFVYGGVGIWVLIGIISQRLVSPVLVWEVLITAIIGLVLLIITIIYQAIKNE
ncbi:MAG: conserved membrane protein of unknown function [Promethearchaeota archaeon]|jgi:hypothetical protein|nr:MAG: conserved membrane protein of unknown function [Candidatus Lokiarchaeota archaeon]